MASGKKSENGKPGKSKNKGNIASFVRGLVETTVEEMGYRLWDVEFVKEGAFYYLRFTIDTPEWDGGITIDDCEKVHRKIEPLIDEADPIEDFYYMEVSSPGIERVIRTDAHFAWAAARGETLRLKLFTALSGKKEFLGRLLSSDGEMLTFQETREAPPSAGSAEEGEKITIPRSAVSKAVLYYDYDGGEDAAAYEDAPAGNDREEDGTLSD